MSNFFTSIRARKNLALDWEGFGYTKIIKNISPLKIKKNQDDKKGIKPKILPGNAMSFGVSLRWFVFFLFYILSCASNLPLRHQARFCKKIFSKTIYSIFDMKVTLMHHTTESVSLSFDVDCSTKTNDHSSSKKPTNWNKQTKKKKKQIKHILQNQPTPHNTTQITFLRVKILLYETSWHQRDSSAAIKKNNTIHTRSTILWSQALSTGTIFPCFAKAKKLGKCDLWCNYVIRVSAARKKKKNNSVLQDVFTCGRWGHHSLRLSYSEQFYRWKAPLFFVLLQNMMQILYIYMQICLNMPCSIGFNFWFFNFLVILPALNVAFAVEWGI